MVGAEVNLLIPSLAIAIAGFASGYALKGVLDGGRIARAEAQVEQCQRAREADARAAAEEAARRLSAAQSAERRAQLELQATKEKLHDTDRKLKQALSRAARADRVCLSADTRRMLDDARGAADRVPETAGQPASNPAAAAADPGGSASERAIAEWVADAIRLYGECRARIDAIRRWDEETHGK